AVERELPEVAQAAHRRPFRASGQRGFGAAPRRARLLEVEAHRRRAPLAAEQPAADRARDACADAELRGELDRPRHAGRGLRLARGLTAKQRGQKIVLPPFPLRGLLQAYFF